MVWHLAQPHCGYHLPDEPQDSAFRPGEPVDNDVHKYGCCRALFWLSGHMLAFIYQRNDRHSYRHPNCAVLAYFLIASTANSFGRKGECQSPR